MGPWCFIFLLLNFPLRLWCVPIAWLAKSIEVQFELHVMRTHTRLQIPLWLTAFFSAADHDSWPQINLSKWLGNSSSHQWFPYTGRQNGQVQSTCLLFISFHLLQFIDTIKSYIYYDIFLSTKRLLINNNVFYNIAGSKYGGSRSIFVSVSYGVYSSGSSQG